MSGQRCGHILQEVDAPLDIVEYYAAFAGDAYSFLLESGTDPDGLGRYSFAGRRPFLVFRSKHDAIEIVRDGRSEHSHGDPFEALRSAMSGHRIDPGVYDGCEIPFLGGAVGYFGYELSHHIERLPRSAADDLGLPDCCFLFVDCVLIRDHLEDRTWISALGFDPDEDVALRRAQDALAGMRADLERVEHAGAETVLRTRGHDDADLEIRSMLGRDEYLDVVRRAKEHIVAGDAYEICTTHRLECDFHADAFTLYRDLRRINPAPFASYLSLPDVKVVSASPERHLRLRRDGGVESRPIKGTRPRSHSSTRDRALRQELLTSEKERAENLMIVDLVRNDLGRVCRVGTVRVPELMTVEAHPTVFQMVSTIVGELGADRDVFDLVKAAFPGGSMTGAPKIEAMSIIDSLEPVQRGIYSGSIGYLDFAGNADLSIVIRTILVKDGVAYLQVGGAVVADSDPAAEYQETLDKARALVQALRACARSGHDVRPRAEAGDAVSAVHYTRATDASDGQTR